ncbi:RING finger protein nhl-1 isoform X1 [Cloeon dipterum]|uniref:RING finger protein nhl-1 isoform X1 n=1 Tax=Cloeon dipterum TaxID=197152 RepID=UPI00322096B8
MEQFEQLLTCAICLDRYRIPKLLPCQHSFCMEPCMDGLVDYVRRQVKCPECRAEHRIPYQGVQGFPTNVTLQRFLELHIEITGELPDPNSNQIMERCNVCSEKAYCSLCMHCEKKICSDCKEAHMDILRREISRINNQIRRGLPRVVDAVAMVEKNAQGLALNCASVEGEIDEIHRRLTKALKDRTDYLKNEIDRYLTTEARNLTTLKSQLEQELSNIQANCELADKHMTEAVDWDDCELMDTKDIFLKTVDFIRNFEYEQSDYTRRARFIMSHDPNTLVVNVSNYGELAINMPQPFGVMGSGQGGNQSNTGGLQPPSGPGLMRSKSDHRLASQFRQQEEQYYSRGGGEADDALNGRKFGERPQGNRYGRRNEEYDDDTESRRPSRYRSRFTRHLDNPDDDPEPAGGRSVRFSEESPSQTHIPRKERERVLDTEDVSKGPLSGITRLSDSPRVMKRLQETELKDKKAKEPKPVPVAPAVGAKPPVAGQPAKKTSRQVSEEDEIAKIKKQNKAEASTAAAGAAAPVPTETRPSVDRTTVREEEPARRPSEVLQVTASSDAEESEEEEEPSSPPKASETSSAATVNNASEVESEEESDSNTKARSAATAATTTAPTSTEKPKFQSRFLNTNRSSTPAAPEPKKESSESESEEESESEDDSEDETTSASQQKGSGINSLLARSAQARETATTRTPANDSSYMGGRRAYNAGREEQANKYGRKQEEETPSSRYGSSGYTSRFLNRSKSTAALSPEDEDGPSGGSLASRKYSTEDKYGSGRSRYGTSGVGSNSSSALGGTSELSRSRSTHALKSRENSPERGGAASGAVNGEKDGAALSSWARYLKNKYGNRAKEKEAGTAGSGASASSTAGSAASRRLSLGLPLRNASLDQTSDDDQKNTPTSPTSPTVAAGFANIPRNQYLQKRRQQFKIGSRGSEPGCFTWPRGIAVGPDNTIVVADSSNHRVQLFDSNGIFVKEFGAYGSSEGEFDCLAGVAVNRIGQFIIADRYNHRIQVLDPSGRFLRAFGSQGTADGRFNYPWGVTTDALGFIYVCDKENHRVQVFQSDGTFVGKFGSAGSKPGQLEHPHYIAVSNTNRVIVSDSNNHRIQIFDVNGRVLSTFGSEGSEEGQFKFPRGVAVDDQGYICVGDSGNNRIQIFYPDGTFLRAFGCWGSGDAEFKGLEGVAVMSNGNILVCDRENHRIQVF